MQNGIKSYIKINKFIKINIYNNPNNKKTLKIN